MIKSAGLLVFWSTGQFLPAAYNLAPAADRFEPTFGHAVLQVLQVVNL